MFYVVQLDSETLNEKIVVPSLWLDKYNTHCLLPPFTTAADVESLAKSRASPKHGWQMYSVKFIQSFDTYSQAAESVESSKNRPLMIELEEEEEGHQIEGNDKRKRKRPPFLENYSTETDDEEHGGTTKDDRSIEEIINHIDPCIVKLETMDGVVPLEFYRQQDIDAARNKRPSNCTVLNENPSQLGESSSSSVRPANELLNMKCPCNSSCHRMFFQSFAAMRRQIEDSNRMLYQILGHLTVPPPNLNALAGSPIGFPVTLPIRELSELHSLNTYLSNQGNFTEATINIEQFIKRALPGVDNLVIKELVKRLLEIGVIHLKDTQFVDSSNIDDILPPIQIKKLLKYFSDYTKLNSTGNIISYAPSPTPQLHASNSAKDIQHNSFDFEFNDDWLKNFKIPWSLFPKEALKACNEKTQLTKKHKSEVVRLLVNEILKIVSYPGRKHFRAIAKIIVDKYPETFQDRYESTVIAGGCTTLMKKLEDACDNKRRISDIAINKLFDRDSYEKIKKRKTHSSSYGCLNWQPTDLPFQETRETQKEKKEFLIQEYVKQFREKEKIDDAMKKTFASQRFTINNGLSIQDILAEWPFLMEEEYLLKHYELLMGHDILDLFSKAIPMKGKKIFSFMKTKSQQQILKCVGYIENWEEKLQNSSPEIIGSILLLMAYFNEEESVLFQVDKEAICVRELEGKTSLMTPFIATLSESLYTAEEFIIFCDAQARIFTKNFISAMSVLFAVYYVFNIQYPKGAENTMEFIQRLYAGINPSRGTKKQSSKQKHPNGKMLKLIDEIKSYESVKKNCLIKDV